jgi:tRNA A-37 threonylcarbamoyl transferase component Bud32
MKKEKVEVCGKQYNVIRLLGHGKGGYSYLVEREGRQYVLKQIHHEPCDYYRFDDKIGGERDAYIRLLQLGIRIPKMYEIDMQAERIIKQYIEGETIFDIVMRCGTAEEYLPQIRETA